MRNQQKTGQKRGKAKKEKERQVTDKDENVFLITNQNNSNQCNRKITFLLNFAKI